MMIKENFKDRIFAIINENIDKKVLNEYITFQPDMLNKKDVIGRVGEFNVNGETVKVEPSRFGDYNVYKFGPILGDYLLKFKTEDAMIDKIAEMYMDDENEMHNILEYANGDDILLFHTSNGKNIEFPFKKVGLQVDGVNAFQKRQMRYKKESLDDEYLDNEFNDDKYEDEDEDWMIMWKNSRLNRNNEESYLDYLNRLNEIY